MTPWHAAVVLLVGESIILHHARTGFTAMHDLVMDHGRHPYPNRDQVYSTDRLEASYFHTYD